MMSGERSEGTNKEHDSKKEVFTRIQLEMHKSNISLSCNST